MGGFHLVQHTGQWFELLPEEDAVLRDIFLGTAPSISPTPGTTGNTIWDALPDMEKASGLGFFQLSDVMTRLSLQADLAASRPLSAQRPGRLAALLARAGLLGAPGHRLRRRYAPRWKPW